MGATSAIIGSIAYLVLSMFHGDPPIDDPARLLHHVAARPWWHAAHLANILAVLLWLAAVLLLTETNAVLTLLGSAAFTAQAMLGLSIVLLGTSVIQDRELPRWFGPIGVLAGGAWLVGAVLITFMVIVPATVLACVWLITWGALSWRSRPQ